MRLRFLLHLSALLLCGPVAAVSALCVGILALDYFVLNYFKGLSPSATEIGLLIAGSATTVVAAGVFGYCGWKEIRTNWKRFWCWLAVAAGLFTWFVAGLRHSRFPEPVYRIWASVGIHDVKLDGIARYAAWLMGALRLLFIGVSASLIAALPPLGIAWVCLGSGPTVRWRPGLAAAYGTALVQLGLWVLIVPAIVIIAANSLLTNVSSDEAFHPFLTLIEGVWGASPIPFGSRWHSRGTGLGVPQDSGLVSSRPLYVPATTTRHFANDRSLVHSGDTHSVWSFGDHSVRIPVRVPVAGGRINNQRCHAMV